MRTAQKSHGRRRKLACLMLVWQLLCALALCGLNSASSSAATPGRKEAVILERSVKAAFLFKFIGYVEWPDGTFAKEDSPITIAVLGDDQFADDLAQLVTGRTLQERPLVVRKQKDDNLPMDTHVLFIARQETAHLRARGRLMRPILIVTEEEGALDQGSAINFLMTDGRVRFEVAMDAVEKRHLKLSSRLLTVAQNVRTGAQ
jgi:hypothetical protein